MCSVLKDEFHLKNFGFNFRKEEAFYEGQWRWHPGIFLAFRVIVALYLLAYSIYIIILGVGHPFIVALTNWTFLFETVAFNLAAVVAVVGLIKGRQSVKPSGGNSGGDGAKKTKHIPPWNSPVKAGARRYPPSLDGDGDAPPPEVKPANGKATLREEYDVEKLTALREGKEEAIAWYYKLSWLLSAMTDTLAILVTVAYYGMLFPLSADQTTNYDDLHRHALNSFFVLLDSVFSARPTRLLHVVYPLIYGVLYVVFSVIYWAVDHSHVIYSVLDWNKPGLASGVVIGMAFVAIPLITLLRFGMYRLRLYVFLKVYGEPY